MRILSGEFDDELLNQSPIAHPLQAVQKLAKETIYTARPALEIETAGFEVLGALLGLFTNAVEASAGHARFHDPRAHAAQTAAGSVSRPWR
jgi:dGTPase